MARPGAIAGLAVIAVGAVTIGIVLLDARDPGGASAEAARGMTGGGDPERGRAGLRKYGCSSCHTIPGVRGADGLVGPPLTSIGARTYLAGALPNTPENLVRWIRHPQEIRPPNAMPDLGVTEQDGRDIAAYLYTLK
jgi:cytochrome c